MEFLSLMSKKGVWPHHGTWNELVVRLCGSGNAEMGIRVLTGFVGMGFKPEPESWRAVVESICKERKLLHVFEVLDSLVS